VQKLDLFFWLLEMAMLGSTETFLSFFSFIIFICYLYFWMFASKIPILFTVLSLFVFPRLLVSIG